MRLAITGTTGRVGRALATELATAHEVIELPRAVFDLADPAAPGMLADWDFDVLLNPAGLTGLEHCEDDPELAERVNAAAPAAMAEICRQRGKRMLHFSTDYVFDGLQPGLRREDDPTNPLSVYGKTKERGERAVIEAGGTVMRVSWVFGPEKPAFPDTVLDRALAGLEVAAVADKFSLPAYTTDLAGWTAGLIGASCPAGIFHACNGGPGTSWHGMAVEIAACLKEQHGIEIPEPKALLMNEMAAFRAVRPRHTAMDTGRLAALLGKPPRDWREALREHVESRLISR
ncbi:NAD(P)-dependent oxidoreductase [Luteolibacter sp. Populi]|uniref:SDR family oxidoreductase n=1 Tax=Luteolibacter sp. Populi TaxID=3230487 RepID=UPI003467163D